MNTTTDSLPNLPIVLKLPVVDCVSRLSNITSFPQFVAVIALKIKSGDIVKNQANLASQYLSGMLHADLLYLFLLTVK